MNESHKTIRNIIFIFSTFWLFSTSFNLRSLLEEKVLVEKKEIFFQLVDMLTNCPNKS